MTSASPAPAPNDWQPDVYARNAAFVPAMAADLARSVAARSGDRVLDLGCGDGALVPVLAQDGAIVVGVDASAAMVDAARARGVDARLAAAERLDFDRAFDVVFSNAMLHWTRDIDAVLAGVFRALRPGGRFVGEFGGHGCVQALRDAAREMLTARGTIWQEPWYFPTDRQFAAALSHAGFDVDETRLFSRPTPLPGGIAEWLETFGGPVLEPFPPQDRLAVVRAIEARLAPTHRAPDGRWTMDYVRLRFRAHRP